MKPMLIIMAAGMGSRFGGLKQMTAVDGAGQVILDYSAYDAIRAGFDKVVCVIKKEIEADFRALVGDRIGSKCDLRYAFQDLHDLPAGFSVPAERQKPWGTAHAVYAARDLIYNDFYFGGDGTSSATTYIGYPTSSGAGNAMQFQMSLGMSSRCADKEGAWSFMRLFLEDEFQNSLWYLPVKRSVFEEKLAELMEPRYQKDENGDYVTDENGEKIMVPLASWGFEDGTIREIYQLSEAQAQNLRDLIESTTKDYSSNEAVSELITNEAKPFFLGQKSAEEVARLIQSKVNIYVNEQR